MPCDNYACERTHETLRYPFCGGTDRCADVMLVPEMLVSGFLRCCRAVICRPFPLLGCFVLVQGELEDEFANDIRIPRFAQTKAAWLICGI